MPQQFRLTLASPFSPEHDLEFPDDHSVRIAGQEFSFTVEKRDLQVFFADPTGLRTVLWFKTGYQPADQLVVQYPATGQPFRRLLFHGGVLSDSPRGDPAVEGFDAAGAQILCAHFQNGLLQDGRENEPAITTFHPGGRAQRAERFRQGMRQDGRMGEPGVVERSPHGHIAYTAHYEAGQLLSEMGPRPSRPASADGRRLIPEPWRTHGQKPDPRPA